eukprot:15456310-Alexandrium_andersonii.AAC.1
MLPWEGTTLSIVDDEGVATVPGREPYLNRESTTRRGMSEEEITEWNTLAMRGHVWEGVEEFIRQNCPH